MNGLYFIVLSNPFQQLWSLTKITSSAPPGWRELIEVARWAPTIHNLQPHQVKIISENEAELFYNPERLLPVEDPESVATELSVEKGRSIYLLQLFPGSPAKLVAKFAGLPKPKNCI